MKNARHEMILELVEKYDIETQEELLDLLFKAGFNVTQATVSRDIRQLELHKIPSKSGRLRYAARPKGIRYTAERYKRILKDAFVSAEGALNIIVVKTVSGMAMAAGAAIDSLDWREVLGCIAGDDTIMLCIRTVEDVPVIIDRLEKIAGLKE